MIGLDCYRKLAFADSDYILKIQEKKLREHLVYCSKNSPYYQQIFENIETDFKKITLKQFAQLPFTEKCTIEQQNNDFCAVPKSKIVDIVMTSGTTGKPVKVIYTDNDLRRLAYNEDKSFTGCGITSKDIVLLTCTMDRCFVAGLAYFLGIRSLGAAAIRNGQSSMESHLEIILEMKPTVIVGVPGFLKNLGLFMMDNGVDPGRTLVSKLVCIGEPLRDKNLELLTIGLDLQNIWQSQIFSTYASSETATTFCECSAQQGGHLHPDLAIVEIVSEASQILPPEVAGEVIITPLGVEGMPLVRYKTGDISFLINKPCSCGRISQRLGPILGRKKQMLKIKGTSLYPQAIYSVLEKINAIDDYYIVVTNENNLSDNIKICASVNEPSYTKDKILNKLQSHLRVKPEVVLLDRETVRQQVYSKKLRKPVRFIDRR